MGGRLRIVAKLPEGEVAITNLSRARARTRRADPEAVAKRLARSRVAWRSSGVAA